ncbi:MAG: thrombospondin type 3 repeat-containing protein [Sandaracinaceae bacterium]|nr:thrombospondin type 3 repeat-containing protein [Sandaracinaceae bacterium]
MQARRLALGSFLIIACALAGCRVGTGITDGDGGVVPDGRLVVRCETTTDTDGDGIYDEFEGSIDFDGDGVPNYQDPDSDGDGFSDRDEHGTDQGCAARDRDGDGHFDFLDLDRDGDGLSDAEERDRYFTDPDADDSDGDGFTDLAEVATGRDPNDASSRIPEDAYYVVLPYLGDAVERDLVFGTTVRKADVFFMMDRTGSMTGEVSRLKSSLSSIVSQMAMSIRDIGVGFGGFAGFGGRAGGPCMTFPLIGEVCGEGDNDDTPFHLYSVITTDPARMVSDVAALEADQGGATWASSNEALYQAATGDGILPWIGPQTCASVPDEVGRRYGYPCFRPGALPIMVVMTDTSSKNGPHTEGVSGGTYDPANFTMGPPPHTYVETLSAVQRIGARVIGVLSGSEVSNPTPRRQFETWALETGTVDAAGQPILFGDQRRRKRARHQHRRRDPHAGRGDAPGHQRRRARRRGPPARGGARGRGPLHQGHHALPPLRGREPRLPRSDPLRRSALLRRDAGQHGHLPDPLPQRLPGAAQPCAGVPRDHRRARQRRGRARRARGHHRRPLRLRADPDLTRPRRAGGSTRR